MIAHVFLMSLKPDASAKQRQALLDGIARLPAEIDGIVSFGSGVDLGLSSGNAEMALLALFEDEQAWKSYLAAPAHRRLASELVSPVLESGMAIQIEVSGPFGQGERQ
jgi:hypothetical protein